MCGSENRFNFSFRKIFNQPHFKIKTFTAADTVILLKLNASKMQVYNLPSFRTLQRTRKKLPFTGTRYQVGEGSCLLLSCHLPFKILICNSTSSAQWWALTHCYPYFARYSLMVTITCLRPQCQGNSWWQTLALCLLLLILTLWFLHCWLMDKVISIILGHTFSTLYFAHRALHLI